MDLNKLFARVRSILLSPKTEWPVIEAERTTTADLYKNYVLWLAAIPAVFTYLKVTLIGISIPFLGTVRVGFLAALQDMVLTYVMTLAVVFVTASIASTLASNFNGQPDRAQALKTVAYAWTGSWLAAVALILPGFGLPVLFAAGIYSVYLLYLGLPVTMKCPREKAGLYAFATVIIAIVLNAIGTFAVTRVSMAGSGLSDSTELQFDEESPLGRLEQWSKEVEKQSKEMTSAQKSRTRQEQAARQERVVQEQAVQEQAGDASAASAAAADVVPRPFERIDPEQLKAFLPEALAGQSRIKVSAQRYMAQIGAEGQLGEVSEATAEYNDGSKAYIMDYGTEAGSRKVNAWDEIENDPSNTDEIKRVFRLDGRPANESWSYPWGRVETVAGGRIVVTLTRSGTDGPSNLQVLRSTLAEADLAGLDALKVDPDAAR